MIQTKNIVITQCKYGIMAYYITDDPIGTCLFYYGEWAEQELEIISKLINQKSNCIDVGANIGTHTIFLSQKCPEGIIFSIEPQFYIFQILNTNIVLNDATNCVPIRSFIMNKRDKIKTTSLFLPPKENENRKLNYGQFNIRDYLNDEGVSTEIIKLDDIDYMGKKIDFIKMDCEGSEKEVLLSGQNLITKSKPHMYLEFNSKNGNDEVLYALNDLGYNCYWHVYTKYNKNNYKSNNINVYLALDKQDTKPSIELVDKFFEGNIVCVHKDNDIRFEHKVLPGDNMIKYLLKHKMIDE